MAKSDTQFTCQTCGHVERKWSGKCASCGAWNSLVEERAPTKAQASRARAPSALGPGRAVPVTSVGVETLPRRELHVGDLDRVLGGGLVPGSLVLIGGEPGVGKSTLLLTCAQRLSSSGVRTLYVSAEESLSQTRLRAERLGALHDELYLLAETDLSVVLDEVERLKPGALIVDSVQTVYAPELDAAPGSVSQVREVTSRMMQVSKGRGVSTFLVGHVTKDGAIAGPRTLEHMVDAVLSFEATRTGPYRLLRAHKNRFGSTNEVAVFEMRGTGLTPIDNPSALFLAERPRGRPGSVVAATVEGSRPLLVEVQALCVSTPFGNPRRTTTGIDTTRVALLAAVLERRCGLSLLGQDLFVNIAGGVAVDEPAVDVPAAVAIASSLRGRAVNPDLVCFGEVGLSGEVRGVERTELRLLEAARLGFTQALVPMTGTDGIDVPAGLTLIRVKSLEEALEIALALD
jgi:DNA repair protein RadA/Sms